MKTKRKGFTLIEMLIVIAIIGILASIVLVGLGPVQRRGRDSRRQADLRQVQTALELYYNKCGYYPGNAASGTTCPGYSANNTWAGMASAISGSGLSVRTIPNDPNASISYQYAANSTGSGYVIAATLEDTGNPAFRDAPTGNINGITCGAPVYCIEF